MEPESKELIAATSEQAVSSDSAKSWTTTDLCYKCAAFNMDLSKQRFFLSRELRDPKCPLCHFIRDMLPDNNRLVLFILVRGVKLGHSEVDKKDAKCFKIKDEGTGNHLSYIFPNSPANTARNHQQTHFRFLRKKSIDYGILRNWVSHCDSTHSPNCTENIGHSEQIRDLMLIDCKTRKIVKAPDNCRYVALSYVWGNSGVVPEPTLHGGKLPIHMPNTLEDALRVVLELNLMYLWIDKYCIDQLKDSEKQHQILHMNKIYSSAYLTIIAAAGHDTTYGLPGVGNRLRSAVRTFKLNDVTWFSAGTCLESLVKTSTWRTRGWTYQEGLFSKRRLMFTNEEVFFECNMWQAREITDFASLESKLLFRNGVNNLKPEDFWYHINLYSGGDLTDQNDAINGLRGLLMAFSQLPDPVYTFWGVPLNLRPKTPVMGLPDQTTCDISFGYALLWNEKMDVQRRDKFPSWSWAGWRGTVKYNTVWGAGSFNVDFAAKFWFMRRDDTPERLSEDIIAKIAADPTIESRDYTSVLQIEAWVMEINVDYWRKPFPAVATLQLDGHGTSTTLRWSLSFPILKAVNPARNEGLTKGKFECLIFSESKAPPDHGLILRRVDNGNRERVGTICLAQYVRVNREVSLDPVDIRDFLPYERQTILLQ
ncbi:hypothetical protein HYFRA_00011225 [Hymenoscyphus fraxineus]|uniref:Heterokaryon incompatibility domain-containing protein n=1 Tax=Hymenoscyphus fraxineus TaxID=746836 RepID=A0A9N9L1C5_9HELO|nr:hypothetical protein HYFRA_00011225 [Hymenoscyphus fraxineus]